MDWMQRLKGEVRDDFWAFDWKQMPNDDVCGGGNKGTFGLEEENQVKH